jgi:hypothetical protein
MPMSPFLGSRGPSPLKDDTVRATLLRAILDDDPVRFRTIHEGARPELAGEHRLYGVLVMTAQGMTPVMVDETGQRVGGPAYTIAANTPIDFLNVHYGESAITVTIGDDVWTTPYPPE